MKNAVALITGSYSGIGWPLTEKLAQMNMSLLLLNRNRQKTEQQIGKLRQRHPDIKIWSEIADFADEEALKPSVTRLAAEHPAINYAFLNAGWIGQDYVVSQHGNDMNLQVNVLANFVLLQLLHQNLSRGNANVVASGSGARRMVRNGTVETAFNRMHASGMKAYAQSKQALHDLFVAYATELDEENVALSVVDLPPTRTDMARNPAVPGIMRAFSFMFSSHERAANRLIAAAMDGSARDVLPSRGQMELLKAVRELSRQ